MSPEATGLSCQLLRVASEQHPALLLQISALQNTNAMIAGHTTQSRMAIGGSCMR